VAELCKAILQLAVMGKLLPQDPKDKPTSELLKLIKVGKTTIDKNRNNQRVKTFASS
jgi:type I restriction enzyme S subunit